MIAAALTNRYAVWAVGRRWGKTEGAKFLLLEEGARCSGRQYKAAYCAPTYKRAKAVYEEMKEALKPIINRKLDTELTLWIAPMAVGDGEPNTGMKIMFWSLEEHDNLRGEGLDRVVIDECADVAEAAFTKTLRWMVMDRGGKFLLIGTPKRVGCGFVWFRRVWMFGQSPEDNPGYVSKSASSHGNPWLPAGSADELIADVMREGGEEAVREEVYAEWLDEEGAVFSRLGDAFVLPWVKEGNLWVKRDHGSAIDRHSYLMGLDIGRHEDATVASVWCRNTREQVALMRIVNETFRDQMEMVHALRARFGKPMIVGDATGVGAPVVEELGRLYGDGVVGKKWSQRRKEEDITSSRMLFQQAEWKFLDVPWQRAEFQNYTREPLPSGRWRYTAPDGMHDDAVAASALVAHYLRMPSDLAPEKPDRLPWFSWGAIQKRVRRREWSRTPWGPGSSSRS